MDVSGEAADLVAREGIQASETAVKLAATGLKNVAALLLALARSNYKVKGQTSADRLQRDGVSAEMLQIKTEDIPKFRKLAKEFGVLYCIAQRDGNDDGLAYVISNQNYAAKLNVVYQEMGYPLPEAAKEEPSVKKEPSRAPQEKSLPEHGNGSKTPAMNEKPSVKARLAAHQAALNDMKKSVPIKQRELIR